MNSVNSGDSILGELGILTGIAFAAERIGDAAKAIRSLFKKRDE